MKTRTQYIIFFVTFIPAIIISLYISFRLFDPYIRGLFVTFGHYDWGDESCQLERIGIDCPSFLGKKQSKPVTVTISNPQDVEQEYHAGVDAIILEQGEYRQDGICSKTLTIAPNQTESFTCEVDPRTVEGEIVWLYTTASPEGKMCEGIVSATCGVQPYYWLYFLIPFIVTVAFIWWFVKIVSREASTAAINEQKGKK